MSPTETESAPTTKPSSVPSRPGLLHYMSLTPDALTRIVDCVKPEKYDERLDPDRFTLREAIAHLADFEVTILDRFAIAHERPGSTAENFDEEARAKEKAYATRDVHHELEVFGNRRRETIMFLETLSPEDMKKTYVHPQRGEMSIKEFIGTVLGHDLYHLDHATLYMR